MWDTPNEVVDKLVEKQMSLIRQDIMKNKNESIFAQSISQAIEDSSWAQIVGMTGTRHVMFEKYKKKDLSEIKSYICKIRKVEEK